MSNIIMIIELVLTVLLFIYLLTALKGQKINKLIPDKDHKKEEDYLKRLNKISLTIPLTEKCRPKFMNEVIGQEKGIRALRAAICGPNPQHVLIYGPPGVGKTAAARLVLEEAKANRLSPFNVDSKFIEIDATTVRFDDRGIADPLIGSVHDPIYQGAGSLGVAGVPQPKPGAVTKAHGGILFIDEIGELHPIEMNKLLKVLEDRKVFLESAYYNPNDNNTPNYIKEIFENGLPADFRLIGATTRSPSEIAPALRSRCVEIFFKELSEEEIIEIVENSVERAGLNIEKSCASTIAKYSMNGRDALNMVQLCSGIAINEDRKWISSEDILWIIENGEYAKRPECSINEKPEIGVVNGLAVYGANSGTVMQIEVEARKASEGAGKINITGIVDEEEQENKNGKIRRKSMVRCSLENVLTVIKNKYSINYYDYDIHINFPGGAPVDGPSAGISLATAVMSAINKETIDNKIAMTGEITIRGYVKPVGGINAKIMGAKRAGIKKVIIPKDNYEECIKNIDDLTIVPVSSISEVYSIVFNSNDINRKYVKVESNVGVLSAEGLKEMIK